jgi:hypothetical protein
MRADRKEVSPMADGKKGGHGIFSWFGRRKRDESHEVTPQETDSTSPQPSASAPKADTPVCPQCGAAMYQRFDLQTRRMQWGCIKYPVCKGRRAT